MASHFARGGFARPNPAFETPEMEPVFISFLGTIGCQIFATPCEAFALDYGVYAVSVKCHFPGQGCRVKVQSHFAAAQRAG